MRQVGPLITTLVGTHIALSLASLARAGIGGNLQKQEESFDAKHYDLMTDFVARMYQGRGIKSECSNHAPATIQRRDALGAVVTGVKLAPTVTFEDPAAICVSEDEVREAFRALEKLEPVCLSPPVCVNVEPRGDSIDLTFQLHQKYTLPLQLQVSLRSLLIVKVQLQQMKAMGLPESEFLITEMKELWHGNPFMWPHQLFFFSKRLNGIVSYHLTSRLL